MTAPDETDDTLGRMVSEFQETVGRLQMSQQALSRLCLQAQQTAGDLESYNRQILASITSGVLNLTAAGVVTMANPAARRILRMAESAPLLGRTAAEVWGADAPLTRLVEETLAEPRNRSRLELRHRAADGAEVWIGLSISLLTGRNGSLAGVTLLMSDLTEVRRLRAELSLRQRLAAMGELTACIAHNFRNSLATIMGNASMLSKRLSGDERNQRAVESVLREVREMESGIRQLLEGLADENAVARPIDLVEVARNVVDGLMPEMERRNVRASVEMRGDVCPVEADSGAMGQLVANLVRNALQAMPEGGELSVRVERDGERILLLVADTGVGIPAEIANRIFEPFVSGRPGGSGLGLALVNGTARRYGGDVEVSNRPGGGTEIRVRFPLKREVSLGG
jgi:two-component system sensor histidine kinase HydH